MKQSQRGGATQHMTLLFLFLCTVTVSIIHWKSWHHKLNPPGRWTEELLQHMYFQHHILILRGQSYRIKVACCLQGNGFLLPCYHCLWVYVCQNFSKHLETTHVGLGQPLSAAIGSCLWVTMISVSGLVHSSCTSSAPWLWAESSSTKFFKAEGGDTPLCITCTPGHIPPTAAQLKL